MLGKWPIPNKLSGNACLGERTLDQESPGSSPGGATESAASDFPVAALSYFEEVMTRIWPTTLFLLLRTPSLRE